jgi:uncharacterized protein (DUF1800 family)
MYCTGFYQNRNSKPGGQLSTRLMNWILCFVVVSLATGCGGSGGTSATAEPSTAQPSIVLTPAASNVRPGDPALQFTAAITGTSSTALAWSVNGIVGGSAALGLINSNGQYAAPASVPASPTSNVVSVQASLVSTPAVQGTSAVTLLNPIPVVSSVSPQVIGVGTFTIQINGSGFMSGAQVMFGMTALTTTFVSSTQLNASGTASASQAGSVVVTVVNPAPGVNNSTTSVTAEVTTGTAASIVAAVRFLEQSTFGPTPALVTQVQQIGLPEFLTSQFVTSGSTYPDPASTVTSLLPTQQVFFTNALNNSDQLRQRVALALSEIWVTSGFTVPPQGMAPYMRLLLQDAFVNYRTLMSDITLSPAMGRYLDMVNNDNPASGQHANENYSRELMQLFTLGVDQLNQDGTMQLDSSGNPIPTYTQANVDAFALAYTGWTYPTLSGGTLQKHNPTNWIGAMVPFESNHNATSKVLLPVNGAAATLPAGQTAESDLSGALDNIFAQPSLPPFVSKQLILRLVTSNPSSAYVKRVADVFVSGAFSAGGVTIGSGQRGDMQAVIAAILLDSEARRGDSLTTVNPGDGHLREPVLFIANILRAFGASSDGVAPANNASSMSEAVMDSPSVFNFFPPDYNIPGTNLTGPEFDLDTTATTLVRYNFVNSFVYGSIGAGTTVNFTSYANLAANPNGTGQLLDSLNALLLHNNMTSDARASILAAVNAVPAGATQNLLRAEAAIYLLLSSSQYQIEQ